MPLRRALTLALTCCAATAAPGQGVATLKLASGPATHPAEFSGIAMVRELADGRVIVLDTTEKRLVVADFRDGSAKPLGRTGDGPEEYRRPLGLFPLPGDSTLVADAMRRWILVAGDRPVETVGAQSPLMSGGGTVRGVDVGGRVAMTFIPRLARTIDQGDSLYLVRLSRVSARGDTVARLRSGFGGPPGSATMATPRAAPRYRPGTRREFMMAPLLGDQAVGFADGWIAVARVDPYRVDWIDAQGSAHRGNPLPGGGTALDEKEKRFYLERLSARDGKPAGPTSDIGNWIATIPPFWGFSGSLFAAPDGAVLIARSETTARPSPTYDLVDRRGVLRARLSLKATERVVGFGARSVYLSAVDSDGIERLRRHSWPAPP